jgi:uncharacterized protein (DUF2336 family)
MRLKDIFGLQGLSELGARGGADMRATLLRVLTDLYVHRLSHTPAEQRQYTELALRLLEAADRTTRIVVARRFAHYPSPPLRVLQRLADDVPEVAAELRMHPLLQPPAVPADPLVSDTATAPPAGNNLAERGERIMETGHPIDRTIAVELNDQFFAATSEERRLILLNLPVVAPVADYGDVSHDPALEQRLQAAALTGNREDFASQLAPALRIPREQARRITRDGLGEPVIVAAKTLRMPREVLYRVLMFLNPAVGHSVERVHALAALYDEISEPAAAGMLSVWQALQPRARLSGKHQPLGYDDETRRYARPSTTTTRRTSALTRFTQRRNAS